MKYSNFKIHQIREKLSSGHPKTLSEFKKITGNQLLARKSDYGVRVVVSSELAQDLVRSVHMELGHGSANSIKLFLADRFDGISGNDIKTVLQECSCCVVEPILRPIQRGLVSMPPSPIASLKAHLPWMKSGLPCGPICLYFVTNSRLNKYVIVLVEGTLECLVLRVLDGKSFHETFLSLMLDLKLRPSLVIYCGPEYSDLEWVAEFLTGSKTFALENVREFPNFQRSTFGEQVSHLRLAGIDYPQQVGLLDQFVGGIDILSLISTGIRQRFIESDFNGLSRVNGVEFLPNLTDPLLSFAHFPDIERLVLACAMKEGTVYMSKCAVGISSVIFGEDRIIGTLDTIGSGEEVVAVGLPQRRTADRDRLRTISAREEEEEEEEDEYNSYQFLSLSYKI